VSDDGWDQMVGTSGPEPFKARTPYPRPIQRKLAVTCSRLGDMEADLNVPEGRRPE
jgi:hypothetical protein